VATIFEFLLVCSNTTNLSTYASTLQDNDRNKRKVNFAISAKDCLAHRNMIAIKKGGKNGGVHRKKNEAEMSSERDRRDKARGTSSKSPVMQMEERTMRHRKDVVTGREKCSKRVYNIGQEI